MNVVLIYILCGIVQCDSFMPFIYFGYNISLLFSFYKLYSLKKWIILLCFWCPCPGSQEKIKGTFQPFPIPVQPNHPETRCNIYYWQPLKLWLMEYNLCASTSSDQTPDFLWASPDTCYNARHLIVDLNFQNPWIKDLLFKHLCAIGSTIFFHPEHTFILFRFCKCVLIFSVRGQDRGALNFRSPIYYKIR